MKEKIAAITGEVEEVIEERILENPNVNQVLRFSYLKQVTFVGLVFLVLIGDVISSSFPRLSYIYWLSMVPILGFSAVFLETSRIVNQGGSLSRLATLQTTHWGGTAMAVVVIFFLLKNGQVDDSGAGLAIHVILALSTFLSGVYLGWKFYSLGILLFITALLVGYNAEFATMLLLTFIPITFLGLYLEDHFFLPVIRRKKITPSRATSH